MNQQHVTTQPGLHVHVILFPIPGACLYNNWLDVAVSWELLHRA